jgi:hypothetical protein
MIVTAMPAAASPSTFASSAPGIASPTRSWSETRGSGHATLWLGLAAAAATTYSAFNDGWLTDETTEAHSAGEGRLSRALQPAGNLSVLGPALLLAYGAARWTGNEDLADASRRIGTSIAVAGLTAFVLKEAVGRERPREARAPCSLVTCPAGSRSGSRPRAAG